MNVYSVYQITCGYTAADAYFKETLSELLTEYYEKHSVCVTVNNVLFGVSMYPGKYACSSEKVATIIISVNPTRTKEGVGPHVKWFADRLAKLHDQHVVICNGVSLADSTIVGSKN